MLLKAIPKKNDIKMRIHFDVLFLPRSNFTSEFLQFGQHILPSIIFGVGKIKLKAES